MAGGTSQSELFYQFLPVVLLPDADEIRLPPVLACLHVHGQHVPSTGASRPASFFATRCCFGYETFLISLSSRRSFDLERLARYTGAPFGYPRIEHAANSSGISSTAL